MDRDGPDCIHCGFCLPACPTYDVMGTEMDSPRGRLMLMDAIEDGRLEPSETVIGHLDACLGCRACETACPSGVRYGHRLEGARARLHDHPARPAGRRRLEWLVQAAMASPPALQAAGTGAARWLARLAGAPGPDAHGTLATARRLLAAVPSRRLRLPTHVPPAPGAGRARDGRPPRVALLLGCVSRTLFGHVHEATVRLLTGAGCEVVVPPGQRCCGALHHHGGDLAGARALARRNVAAFEAVGRLDALAVNAAGCGSTVKAWGELLQDDARWGPRAARLASLAKDALELLDELGVRPRREVTARVAYHDACHLAHAQGIREAPRRLLAAVPGLELLPLSESERCCGSAGIYNLLHPDVADRLADDKRRRLARSGADTLAAANPGCLLHLAAAAGDAFRTVHPLELLDEATRP